jgi:peptide chain release factor 2
VISRCVFDIAGLEQEIGRLERESAEAGFWDNPQAAQATMRRLSEIRGTVETWRGIERRVGDATELAELAIADEDDSIREELERETAALTDQLNDLEFELTFSGPYDRRPAILAVHAGAGGTESQDWAEMLLRMYVRWAERHGYPWEMLDHTPGEEAGIKSATVEISGPLAYGWLKSERGVHRLVRQSPFDAEHKRHTSFALVEVMPEADESVDVQISPDDLRIDVFRASGHGGQNVQKNSTAIRITHIPTNIVVTCQNERSQHRNKESAMKVLESRLLELELEKKAQEQAKLKGEFVSAGWGNAIRSYVLHPYKLVKDQRSGYDSTDPFAVLDGDLDEILKSYLKSTLGAA